MRKTLIALGMAVVLFTTVSIQPKRAEAVVIAVSGGAAVPALVVLGSGIVGALTFPFWGMLVGSVTNSPKAGGYTAIGFLVAGVIAIVVGLVWLDESGAGTLQFTALNVQQGKTLGASAEALRYYNHELPEANAVAEDLADDVLHHPEHATQAYLGKQWAQAVIDGTISSQTLSVIQKVATNMARKMNEAIAKKTAKPKKAA